MFIPHLLQAGKSMKIRTSGELWTPERSHPYNCPGNESLSFLGGVYQHKIKMDNEQNMFFPKAWMLSNIATLDSVAQNLDDQDDFFHQHVPRWPCNILSYPQSWWNGHLFGGREIYYTVQNPSCQTDLAVDTTWYDCHCLSFHAPSVYQLFLPWQHCLLPCSFVTIALQAPAAPAQSANVKVMSTCMKSAGWIFASEAQSIHGSFQK